MISVFVSSVCEQKSKYMLKLMKINGKATLTTVTMCLMNTILAADKSYIGLVQGLFHSQSIKLCFKNLWVKFSLTQQRHRGCNFCMKKVIGKHTSVFKVAKNSG